MTLVLEDATTEPRSFGTQQVRLAARAVESWLASGGGTGPEPDWGGLELAFLSLNLPEGECLAAVREWFRIILQERAKVPSGTSLLAYPPIPSDATHSALLARLLSGSPALDDAPPTAFGCPWYAVVEKPGPHRCQVRGALTLAASLDGDAGAEPLVAINQAPWTVVEETGEDEMVVRWRGRGPAYRLIRHDDGTDEARIFPWTLCRI